MCSTAGYLHRKNCLIPYNPYLFFMTTSDKMQDFMIFFQHQCPMTGLSRTRKIDW